MNEIKLINLNELKLKTFTEQNVLDYCQLNSINPNNIKTLLLSSNELTDISEIKLFKNVEYLDIANNELTDISVLKVFKNLTDLYISFNKIKDISVIQYLKKLQILDIDNLELKSDQIEYIKLLKNLKHLYSENGFKNKTIIKKLFIKNANISVTL